MPTPSELVTDSFTQARSYIADHKEQLLTFTNTLNAMVQNAPLVDVTFTPIADPGIFTIAPFEPPEDYTSEISESLRAGIAARLAGGTGLPTAVEEAIWDRARERELTTAQAAIDQVTRDSEALGYQLPPGVMVDGIRREQRSYYDRVSGLSRDIAVKQADLEQSNLQKIYDQGITFETVIADVNLKRSQVALNVFQANVARFTAEVDQDVKHWEANMKMLEAQMTYTINGQKLNSEIIRANASINLEAAKAGTQTFAQLLASAYGMIHASAGVSASAGNSVSYSYSNDTATAPPSITVV